MASVRPAGIVYICRVYTRGSSLMHVTLWSLTAAASAVASSTWAICGPGWAHPNSGPDTAVGMPGGIGSGCAGGAIGGQGGDTGGLGEPGGCGGERGGLGGSGGNLGGIGGIGGG